METKNPFNEESKKLAMFYIMAINYLDSIEPQIKEYKKKIFQYIELRKPITNELITSEEDLMVMDGSERIFYWNFYLRMCSMVSSILNYKDTFLMAEPARADVDVIILKHHLALHIDSIQPIKRYSPDDTLDSIAKDSSGKPIIDNDGKECTYKDVLIDTHMDQILRLASSLDIGKVRDKEYISTKPWKEITEKNNSESVVTQDKI